MLGWLKTLFGGTNYEALANEPGPEPKPGPGPPTTQPPHEVASSETQLWAKYASNKQLLASLNAEDFDTVILALLEMWHFRRHPSLGDLLERITAVQLRALPRWTTKELDANLAQLQNTPVATKLGPLLRAHLDISNRVIHPTTNPQLIEGLISSWPTDPRIPRWALTCLAKDTMDGLKGGARWVSLAKMEADTTTAQRARTLDLDRAYKAFSKGTNGFVSVQHKWDKQWSVHVETVVAPPAERLAGIDELLRTIEAKWETLDSTEAHRKQLATLQHEGNPAADLYINQYWDRLVGALRTVIVRKGLRFEMGHPVAIVCKEDLAPSMLSQVHSHPDWATVREITLPRELPDPFRIRQLDHNMRKRRLVIGKSERTSMLTDLPCQLDIIRHVVSWPELSRIIRNKQQHPLREVHVSPHVRDWSKLPSFGRSGVGKLEVLGLVPPMAEHFDRLREALDGVRRLEVRVNSDWTSEVLVEAAQGWADEVWEIRFDRTTASLISNQVS